jgi:hypothetical protein
LLAFCIEESFSLQWLLFVTCFSAASFTVI